MAWLQGPGFLGTGAPLASDLSLVTMILSLGLFTFGRHLALTHHYQAHQRVQTVGVILTAVVAVGFMLNSFTTHILPGIPSKLLEGDYGVSTLHAFIGATAVLGGIFMVLRGNNLVPAPLRFSNYRPFMRATYALFAIATLLGIVVYALVFILGI